MAESSEKLSPQTKPLAASGAEVIFLVLLVILGIGLCRLIEKNFTLYWTEPTEQRAFETPRIQDKQAELSRVENSIKETEKQLDVVALEQLKQRAVQRSLETANPNLIQPSPGAAANALPTPSDQNYRTAKTQEQTANAVYAALMDRIASLKATSDKVSQELKADKQIATNNLRRERSQYLLAKFGAALLVPLLLVIMVFLIGAVLLSLFARRRVWAIRGLPPVLFVAGVLLILLAYQVLEIAGAALMGIVVFLIMLQRIKWAPRLSGKG